ncbi:MAG: cysteine desulfurase [Candidatus Nealsonbacteria bacterium]|nr:cysteine desulfurase [Candidatus Nealsonbacteria bacterium]
MYLDYAATTPVDPRVLKAMLPYFAEKFGNTMSLHSLGQEAKMALEESRIKVAGLMGAKPEEVIFTGSATESNNLVLKGIAFANKKKGNHIIISPVEHDCIMESSRWLASQGFEVTKLPVDKYGLVDPADVARAIKPETILVSVIHGSNEIGTVQPISEIGKICRERGVYSHTDASQSFGKIPIDVGSMSVDLLTASSHKMYGPKGAACLFIRKGVKITPLLHGGGHESGLRSSTSNVPAIVGFGEACAICQKEMKLESRKTIALRDKLIKGLLKIPGSHLNGHPVKRLPNNASISFDFIEGESIVIQLDLEGVAGSTGSACSSAKLEPSHVLMALGMNVEQAHGSLRLSLGRWTKESEINFVVKILPKIVKQLREISPFKNSYKF